MEIKFRAGLAPRGGSDSLSLAPRLLLAGGDLGVPGLVEAKPQPWSSCALGTVMGVSSKYPFSEGHRSCWLEARPNDLTVTNDIAMALLGALRPGTAPSTLANLHSSLGTPPFSLNGPEGRDVSDASQVSGAPDSARSRLRNWRRFSRTDDGGPGRSWTVLATSVGAESIIMTPTSPAVQPPRRGSGGMAGA